MVDHASIAMPPAEPAKKLGATLGAEISNVDLRRPLDDETLAEIERALLAFKVLFFRDQDLSPAEHAAFGRRFGKLEVHPFLPSPEGCPEVVLLAKTEDVGGYENGWHSDVSWRVAPSLGSILRCRECPATGGDTLFADMAPRIPRPARRCSYGTIEG